MTRILRALAASALFGAGAAAQAAPAAPAAPATSAAPAPAPTGPLLLQTDFGLQDGAVAELKGVAYAVSPSLYVADATHLIPPFDISEAAYRLQQVAPFWPAGTVFVSVVDPGVGTARRSVVMRTRSGQFFVTPDNGTLTYVAQSLGVSEVREIDESVNRRPGSEWSATFHGRDVYVYTGARLAAGKITFEQVGPSRGTQYVALDVRAAAASNGAVTGQIVVLDRPYGNLWTNIDTALVTRTGMKPGDRLRVTVRHAGKTKWTGTVPWGRTFGDVPEGKPVLYVNSLDRLALALNMGDFAKTHGVSAGAGWTLEVAPSK